jgi:hypothetical protein
MAVFSVNEELPQHADAMVDNVGAVIRAHPSSLRWF